MISLGLPSQYELFFNFILLGILLGGIYGLLSLITLFLKRKYIINLISDLSFCILYALCFLYFINKINMGEIRFFLIASYFLGFFLERITFGKMFAKIYNLLYNKTSSLYTRFKSSKIGKVLFK